MVLHFAEISDEDRLIRLESKCAEIRNILMGTLLLAKEVYKEELLKSPGKEEFIRVLEEYEDAYIDSSIKNRFSRLENALDIKYAGIETQLVVSNMILPEEVCVNDFFRNRWQMQMRYLEEIQNRFNLPMLRFPMMQDEIKGVDAISAARKILTWHEKR